MKYRRPTIKWPFIIGKYICSKSSIVNKCTSFHRRKGNVNAWKFNKSPNIVAGKLSAWYEKKRKGMKGHYHEWYISLIFFSSLAFIAFGLKFPFFITCLLFHSFLLVETYLNMHMCPGILKFRSFSIVKNVCASKVWKLLLLFIYVIFDSDLNVRQMGLIVMCSVVERVSVWWYETVALRALWTIFGFSIK